MDDTRHPTRKLSIDLIQISNEIKKILEFQLKLWRVKIVGVEVGFLLLRISCTNNTHTKIAQVYVLCWLARIGTD
jgi:uncharacterized protein involved in cysteine biosynthesis